MGKISDFAGQPADPLEQMILECCQPFSRGEAVSIRELAGRLRPLFNQAVRNAMKSETG